MELSEITTQILDIVVPALITILGSILMLLAWKLNAWIHEKVKNAKLLDAVDWLTRLVVNAVAEAEQTTVVNYKAAVKDGKLTREDGEKVRDGVVEVVKRHLGEKGLEKLEKRLGVDRSTVEGMIRTLIESSVTWLKRADRRPTNTNSALPVSGDPPPRVGLPKSLTDPSTRPLS